VVYRTAAVTVGPVWCKSICIPPSKLINCHSPKRLIVHVPEFNQVLYLYADFVLQIYSHDRSDLCTSVRKKIW